MIVFYMLYVYMIYQLLDLHLHDYCDKIRCCNNNFGGSDISSGSSSRSSNSSNSNSSGSSSSGSSGSGNNNNSSSK